MVKRNPILLSQIALRKTLRAAGILPKKKTVSKPALKPKPKPQAPKPRPTASSRDQKIQALPVRCKSFIEYLDHDAHFDKRFAKLAHALLQFNPTYGNRYFRITGNQKIDFELQHNAFMMQDFSNRAMQLELKRDNPRTTHQQKNRFLKGQAKLAQKYGELQKRNRLILITFFADLKKQRKKKAT